MWTYGNVEYLWPQAYVLVGVKKSEIRTPDTECEFVGMTSPDGFCVG